VEYCTVVWSPHYKKDKQLTEKYKKDSLHFWSNAGYKCGAESMGTGEVAK